MKSYAMSLAALVFGVVALGLAAIPGIATGRLLPFDRKEPQERKPAPPALKDAVTFKYKKFSVTFSRGKNDNQEDGAGRPNGNGDAGVVDAPAPDPAQTVRFFTIASVCCSLLGLTLGPISWGREKRPVLSGSAMGICCLALVWQYVGVGIAVGVAVAVCFMIFSRIG